VTAALRRRVPIDKGEGSPMRVSTHRQTRLERFTHPSAHTSPTTMVLPSLVIQVKLSDQLMTKVELRGELDAVTAGRCGEFLLALLAESSPHVVFDLSKLTFCDAGGLGTFVRVANRAEAAGGGVTLTGVRPMLAKQLRVTGLDRRLRARGPTDSGPVAVRRHLTPDP
jgi:anti-anti-sigma factor